MLVRTVVLLSIVVSASGAHLEVSATAAIAQVLCHLEHTCSGPQCAVLDWIITAEATTSEERTLARAVRRILHTPHPDDLGALQALRESPATPPDIRELAGIVESFVHVATMEQRESLAALSR